MIPMATITKKIFTCDVCGKANDVQRWAFGFDGKRYEIDLCPTDTNGLNKVVAGYASQARKVTARQGQRRNSHRPKASRPGKQAAKASGARAKSAGSKEEAGTSRSQPQSLMAAPEQAATTSRSQPPEVMAAPKQVASRSEPQDVMAAPKQRATATRSQPQKAKAAPKRAVARTSRSQPQKATKAKAVPKKAATASRSQPQKVRAASKQAATTSRSQPQKVRAASKQAATASRSQPQKVRTALKQAATASRSQLQKAKAAPKQVAKASGKRQEKGVYVYGILPADIEVAAETQGVGEHPGPLGIIYSDGLAALISEVGLPARLGSPEDLRIYREILDSTAIEVPVVPLRFGTVFTGEGSVADELLAPRHDEFATALEQLEGRVQFLIRGRYVEEALTARREEDTRALQRAMEGISVDSVVREPAHEREAIDVAFLVDVDEEREVERVIEGLAREWEGRIEVRLLGPMAAYDFVMTDSG
jgi:chemotaxis protein histidine kinase CheA